MRIALAFVQPASWIATSYITSQRRRFLETSRCLPELQRSRLRPFFPNEVLDTVKIAKGSVPAPPLYEPLRKLGFKDLPDLSTFAGITFVDVIVHSERLSDSFLFHELVHVVQYEVLGLKRFAERYVHGFLATGSYDDIPLERQAYNLGGRYERRPQETFSVLDAVLEWSAANRF